MYVYSIIASGWLGIIKLYELSIRLKGCNIDAQLCLGLGKKSRISLGTGTALISEPGRMSRELYFVWIH